MLMVQATTASDGDHKSLAVAAVAAAATIIVAIISALAAYMAGKRQQRRETYGEAVRAAVGWKEFLYLVRRRQAEDVHDLVQRFHALQDDIAYYQGWVGAESKYMARSYRQLVTAIKSKTEQSINAAWAEPLRDAPGNATTADDHPEIDADVDVFLKDVRSHLSPQPWRKLAMAWRNRGT